MLNPNYKKQKAIIFDIDFCLCDSSERLKRINFEAFKHKDKKTFVESLRHYNSDCVGDKAIPLGVGLLDALCNYYSPDCVAFITARGADGYKPTLEWLEQERIWTSKCRLIMYPEDLGNFEFNTMLDHAAWKGQMAKELIRDGYEILICVDDDQRNVSHYSSLGLPVLKFIYPVIK